MRVLLVVDAQASYPASQLPELVARIEAEAECVVQSGGLVLEIRMDDGGAPTCKLPVGTPVLWKRQDDGGDMVYAWLVGKDLVNKDLNVLVAGVNLSCCVWLTANGIGYRLYEEHALCDNVTIVPRLCGDGSKWRLRFDDVTIVPKETKDGSDV